MESFARMSLLRANREVETAIRVVGLADAGVCDSSVLAKLDVWVGCR